MDNYTKSLEEQNEQLQKKLADYEKHYVLRLRGMDDGYADRDYVMLYACFTVLCDFIELEWDGKLHTYSEEDYKACTDDKEERMLRHQGECKKELWDLYIWWRDEHPKLTGSTIDTWDIEQNKLEKLIELRAYLWT
jgi:hypothetical protein